MISSDEFQEIINQVARRFAEFRDQKRPIDGVTQGEFLHSPLPEDGHAVDELLDTLFGQLIPNSVDSTSGGYFAYVPGGGLLLSAVADLIVSATNRYVTLRELAPSLASIEDLVIRWFCEMLDYPTDAAGVLTSGGSIANLSAVVAARDSATYPKARCTKRRSTFRIKRIIAFAKPCTLPGSRPKPSEKSRLIHSSAFARKNSATRLVATKPAVCTP